MYKNIFETLLIESREGTKINKKISHFLLNNKSFKINSIKDLSLEFNTTNATISRFIKSLGYDYFKFFIKDWNAVSDDENKIYKKEHFDKEHGKNIANKLNIASNVYIISSSRSEAFSLFFQNSLNIKERKCKYIYNDDLKNIKFKENDLIIIITVSGHSLRISKTISLLNKIKSEPNIFFISQNSKEQKFDKPKNVEFILINGKTSKVLSSTDYFHSIVHMTKITYYILEYLNRIM